MTRSRTTGSLFAAHSAKNGVSRSGIRVDGGSADPVRDDITDPDPVSGRDDSVSGAGGALDGLILAVCGVLKEQKFGMPLDSYERIFFKAVHGSSG